MLDASSVNVPVTIQFAPDCAALAACSPVLILRNNQTRPSTWLLIQYNLDLLDLLCFSSR